MASEHKHAYMQKHPSNLHIRSSFSDISYNYYIAQPSSTVCTPEKNAVPGVVFIHRRTGQISECGEVIIIFCGTVYYNDKHSDLRSVHTA